MASLSSWRRFREHTKSHLWGFPRRTVVRRGGIRQHLFRFSPWHGCTGVPLSYSLLSKLLEARRLSAYAGRGHVSKGRHVGSILLWSCHRFSGILLCCAVLLHRSRARRLPAQELFSQRGALRMKVVPATCMTMPHSGGASTRFELLGGALDTADLLAGRILGRTPCHPECVRCSAHPAHTMRKT